MGVHMSFVSMWNTRLAWVYLDSNIVYKTYKSWANLELNDSFLRGNERSSFGTCHQCWSNYLIRNDCIKLVVIQVCHTVKGSYPRAGGETKQKPNHTMHLDLSVCRVLKRYMVLPCRT